MPALTFKVGPACAGGNHWDVTATLGGRSVTVRPGFDVIKTPLTKDEGAELATLLLRLLVSSLSIKTIDNARAKLSATNLSLKID